jgi:hypothetical protein
MYVFNKSPEILHNAECRTTRPETETFHLNPELLEMETRENSCLGPYCLNLNFVVVLCLA